MAFFECRRKSADLDRISGIAQSILRRHNRLSWSQRTRSNRESFRFEDAFEAVGHLEAVLRCWQHVGLSDGGGADTLKSRRQFFACFRKDGVGFVELFLRRLVSFKSDLLDFFLRPLRSAFPVELPRELLEHIWTFSQSGQPRYTVPLEGCDRAEARKFLLLVYTSVLAVHNAACAQESILRIFVSAENKLTLSNFGQVHPNKWIIIFYSKVFLTHK
jgi:hypothetical protein